MTQQSQNTEKQPRKQQNRIASDEWPWIRHNLDTARGVRFVMLRLAGGYEAHGIYWALIEYLYKYKNQYPISDSKQKEALASLLHISADKLQTFIEQGIECKLLEIRDGFLSCERVGEEIEKREGISRKRAKSGRRGGDISASKRQANAKHLLNTVEAKPSTRQDKTRHNKTRQENKGALSSADFVFPSTLDDQRSKNALDAYIRHRLEIKKPVTRTQIEAVLKKYALTPGDFVPNLEHSIANGWQGIHPPSDRKQNPQGPSVDPRVNVILNSLEKMKGVA